jgi:hypothetical protein
MCFCMGETERFFFTTIDSYVRVLENKFPCEKRKFDSLRNVTWAGCLHTGGASNLSSHYFVYKLGVLLNFVQKENKMLNLKNYESSINMFLDNIYFFSYR